jgi:2-(1,2-epoxy-1,2-dihydrophenyl)acetyl-CoA isomerase
MFDNFSDMARPRRKSMSGDAAVLYEAANGVATVTINNPARRNALSPGVPEALVEAVETAAQAPDVRVVILAGAGKDFCVGADINVVAGGVLATDAHFQRLTGIYRVPLLLREMSKVTIAAVDGGCAGAGLGFALACDFRFVTPRAVISTAFLKVGLAGDMGTSWLLSRLVGAARARELSFFPNKLGGEEAARLGLATRVVEPDRLLTEARAAAEELASRAPLALRMLKANFLSAESLSYRDYLEVEASRHSIVLTGSQAREAFKAAAEKREPDFG